MQNPVKKPQKGNQANLPKDDIDISPDDAARVLKEHRKKELQEASDALYALCERYNVILEVQQRVVIVPLDEEIEYGRRSKKYGAHQPCADLQPRSARCEYCDPVNCDHTEPQGFDLENLGSPGGGRCVQHH